MLYEVITRLNDELVFPHPQQAEASGLLAVGGDLSPARILFAYSIGVFPWYNPDEPVITSYSIHYTKLYEARRSRTPAGTASGMRPR